MAQIMKHPSVLVDQLTHYQEDNFLNAVTARPASTASQPIFATTVLVALQPAAASATSATIQRLIAAAPPGAGEHRLRGPGYAGLPPGLSRRMI